MRQSLRRLRPPARSALLSCLVAVSLASAGLTAEVHCPRLGPPPAGDSIVNVTPAEASILPAIVSNAGPYTTILLADGYYPIDSYLRFTSEHVTLRSASGNRDAVVLDAGYSGGAAELLFIDVAHITVADLTLKRAWYHTVHVVGGGHYVTLYNLKIVDSKEQFVKVNPSSGQYADYGLAACSELELTGAGRTFIHENPTPGFLCYTGGFDLHQTWEWVIRDNVVKSIYCTNGGLAEHGIHFFHSNRDPVVERNLLLDNARGIGFGLGQDTFRRTFLDDPFAGTEMEGRENEVVHIGGVIQNNIIHADIGQYYDSGIGLESAWGSTVRHNTIYSEEGSFTSAIDVRFSGSESVLLANNLYYPRMTVRNGAPTPAQTGNVEASAAMFVSLAADDLHLVETATGAIDQGADVGVTHDFDGALRDGSPDVGADELNPINSEPWVVIGTPPDGSLFDSSSFIDFAGSAGDLEDGALTAALTWESDLDGDLGSGGAVTTTLTAGLHLVTAAVTDSGGLDAMDRVTVAVTGPGCPADAVLANDVVDTHEIERAVRTITAGDNLIVGPTGALDLTAGSAVILVDGIEVQTGGELVATVSSDACTVP